MTWQAVVLPFPYREPLAFSRDQPWPNFLPCLQGHDRETMSRRDGRVHGPPVLKKALSSDRPTEARHVRLTSSVKPYFQINRQQHFWP